MISPLSVACFQRVDKVSDKSNNVKPFEPKEEAPISVSKKRVSVPSKTLEAYFTGNKSVWEKANQQKRVNIVNFAEGYKNFLNNAKTDISAVEQVTNRVKAFGFQPWPEQLPPNILLQPGQKFYRNNRDRSLSLIVIGQQPATQGIKMVASHLDSPCLTLKAQPLHDFENIAMFETVTHGGIKPHQWSQRNLALIGNVVKQDGTTVKVNIGSKEDDPVFVIPDLAPHVDNKYFKKTLKESFPYEKLRPIVGLNKPDTSPTSNPVSGWMSSVEDKSSLDQSVSAQVETVLNQMYGITRKDLLSADLYLVPAEKARDCGFDRSIVSGYGSDDKSSVYASTEALLSATAAKIPDKTMVSSYFSNEEISSYNTYGARSEDVKDMVWEIIHNTQGRADERDVRQAFKNSLILSADVTTALDPLEPNVEDKYTHAKLGYGPVVAKGSKLKSTAEATASFMRTQQNVNIQPFSHNQDTGGGYTLGMYLATQNNADVVDTGIAVLGMHAPVELVSKADLYEHYASLYNYYTQ